ncbi:MAG TPA: arsenic resistance N-acetyltransferase ArsN2 [Candidatus Udaeobacter sp.]|nr:arsenic resistance N-acetyltransferase ArsN2 [Candidatus Udaeobacter sp.]
MVHTFCPVAFNDREWGQFSAALKIAGLPADDLLTEGQSFYQMSDVDGPIAFGGFYIAGTEGLLRSIVVLPNRRRTGIGRRFVDFLLDRMKRRGVEQVWLLTTTAEPFFEKLQFRTRPRDDVPTAIAGTREFALLCPASAVLMCRDLP